MKHRKNLEAMDAAIFQLQSAQRILAEAAHSEDSARAVAELMAAPIDTLTDCLDRLLDKVPS